MSITIAPVILDTPPTGKDRSAERQYRLVDLTQPDNHGSPVTPMLVVSTYHDRERKLYRFAVDRQVLIQRDGYAIRQTVIKLGRGVDERIRPLWFAERADRYSRTHLITAQAEYIRDFIEPNLDALLDYAVGALLEAN